MVRPLALVALLPLFASCPRPDSPISILRDRQVSVGGVVTSPEGREGGIAVGLYLSESQDQQFGEAVSLTETGLFLIASDIVPENTESLVLAPVALKHNARIVKVRLRKVTDTISVGEAEDIALFDGPNAAPSTKGPIGEEEAAQRLASLQDRAELMFRTSERTETEVREELERETKSLFLRVRTENGAVPVNAIFDGAKDYRLPNLERDRRLPLESSATLLRDVEIGAYVENPQPRWTARLENAAIGTAVVSPWMIELSRDLSLEQVHRKLMMKEVERLDLAPLLAPSRRGTNPTEELESIRVPSAEDLIRTNPELIRRMIEFRRNETPHLRGGG